MQFKLTVRIELMGVPCKVDIQSWDAEEGRIALDEIEEGVVSSRASNERCIGRRKARGVSPA
jgi:hypothetical protein